ncbi:hypothetical protein CKO19_00675 [Rhodovulum adriaticum]|nr:hypothetical protein [Rhodovulum adriaticum]
MAALTAPASHAQTVTEVRFAPGSFGTMISGSITGQRYADYVLRARGGQQMFAALDATVTDGYGTVYFNILSPGSQGYAIYNGAMSGNRALVTLPQDGPYTIRVYLMGNDRDTGKTVAYNLDLSIQ